MSRRRRRRRQKVNAGAILVAFLLIIAIVAVLFFFPSVREKILGFLPIGGKPDKPKSDIIATDNVSIHFLELGNQYTGDSTYIKVGNTDILIDAGSREGSAAVISDYINNYVTDGILEYVVVTHADRDHIAGFAKQEGSIFDLYECKNIIDFAQTNKNTKTYQNYLAERQAEIDAGANHMTAKEVRESGNFVYTLDGGVTMTILDNQFYYEKSMDENNHSVCLLLQDGDHSFLFTGDLEAEGEKSLTTLNHLPEVDLFKAGHHGSYTASTNTLLSVIKPKIVCVCCCAGSTEYTTNMKHVFPAQEFCDRVAPYTDQVYITSMIGEDGNVTAMNGTIVITTQKAEVIVTCSANDTPLKDTAWFKKYRTCPAAWR